MSPLRKWMSEHGRPSWYSWIVVVGTSVLSSTLAIVVSARSLDAEQSARLRSERALCSVVIVQDDAYKNTPPSTPTGKEVAEGMALLRETLNCPPKE